MEDKELLDIYTDYLISSFGATTGTGLSRLLDGVGVLYLVSSHLDLTYDAITVIYRKRWNVEPYHKLLKQNASLYQSPTKTVKTQSNHIFLPQCVPISSSKC
jgi:hypothetical protein